MHPTHGLRTSNPSRNCSASVNLIVPVHIFVCNSWLQRTPTHTIGRYPTRTVSAPIRSATLSVCSPSSPTRTRRTTSFAALPVYSNSAVNAKQLRYLKENSHRQQHCLPMLIAGNTRTAAALVPPIARLHPLSGLLIQLSKTPASRLVHANSNITARSNTESPTR